MIQWLRQLFCSRENLLEEFMRVFPDRCPICACHRFGLQNGFVTGNPPKHEGCIEEKMDYSPNTEAFYVAEVVHKQWPFISIKEFVAYYDTLTGIPGHVGAVVVGLWVQKRVEEYNNFDLRVGDRVRIVATPDYLPVCPDRLSPEEFRHFNDLEGSVIFVHLPEDIQVRLDKGVWLSEHNFQDVLGLHFRSLVRIRQCPECFSPAEEIVRDPEDKYTGRLRFRCTKDTCGHEWLRRAK